MDKLVQLENHSNDLSKAIKNLASYSGNTDIQSTSACQPIVHPEACKDVLITQTEILSNVAKIRTLVYGPTEFLKHLASQIEILASLQWLGEFQVLACIPLEGSVPIQDVAELCNIPVVELSRIIRLTATVGFLDEPQHGVCCHTALSAPFVANPLFLDAAMFLAEVVGPTALHMTTATQKRANTVPSLLSEECAYNLALNTRQSFHVAREEQPRVGRQWSAYLHYAVGLAASSKTVDEFAQLNWDSISKSNVSSRIVEVGAKSASGSISNSLAMRYPALNFVVQIRDADTNIDLASDVTVSSGVTITRRALGSRQMVMDASVYILHLPKTTSDIVTELQIHLSVLRNGGVMLIPTLHLLPELGTLPNPEIETMSRTRDLTSCQLGDRCEMEMTELLELMEGISDGMGGRLTVTKKVHSREQLIATLVVTYQSSSQ